MAASGDTGDISLEKLQLNLENPRHEEKKSRDEAMIELLQNEKIEQLARDIVELGGINPMERLGVFPLKGNDNIYVAAEGNRRLCALLLLDDPEAVPASISQRARYVRIFSQLSEKIDPIVSIPCVIFRDMKEARPWLERLHNGARNGTGRVSWTPEQQARNTGVKKNQAAMQLSELATKLGIVSKEQLDRTITTQTRFVSNQRFRQAMGLVLLKGDSLERSSCWHDFRLMLEKFMSDIANNKINSRSHNNSEKINEYAQKLGTIEDLQRKNVPQGPLEQRSNEKGNKPTSRSQNDGKKSDETSEHDNADDEQPTPSESNESSSQDERPNRRQSIETDDEIVTALNKLQNQKLIDLYQSISTVRLPQHTLLAVIGCWSFFESLTRAHGSTTDLVSYINGQARALNITDTPEPKVRKKMLTWIQESGNITKHDWQAATYDHQQLCNAMDVLKPVIIAIIDGIGSQKQAIKKPLAEQDQS